MALFESKSRLWPCLLDDCVVFLGFVEKLPVYLRGLLRQSLALLSYKGMCNLRCYCEMIKERQRAVANLVNVFGCLLKHMSRNYRDRGHEHSLSKVEVKFARNTHRRCVYSHHRWYALAHSSERHGKSMFFSCELQSCI